MTAANTTFPSAGAPILGPPPRHTADPPATARPVESAARAATPAPRSASSRLDELSESARRFAEVLETTGSVAIAASISGFSPGRLDTYA